MISLNKKKNAQKKKETNNTSLIIQLVYLIDVGVNSNEIILEYFFLEYLN
jgi:hypothetical protein